MNGGRRFPSEIKQFLYIIKPTRLEMLTVSAPRPKSKLSSASTITTCKDLTQQGVAILVGRTQTADEDSLGIIVFKADSDEAAQELRRVAQNNDPAVKQGVMQATLYPFRVALITDDTSSDLCQANIHVTSF